VFLLGKKHPQITELKTCSIILLITSFEFPVPPLPSRKTRAHKKNPTHVVYFSPAKAESGISEVGYLEIYLQNLCRNVRGPVKKEERAPKNGCDLKTPPDHGWKRHTSGARGRWTKPLVAQIR
jgi:hypothetical protein